jgi:hypothetical protein
VEARKVSSEQEDTRDSLGTGTQIRFDAGMVKASGLKPDNLCAGLPRLKFFGPQVLRKLAIN